MLVIISVPLVHVNCFQLRFQFWWNYDCWLGGFSRHKALETAAKLLSEASQSQLIIVGYQRILK